MVKDEATERRIFDAIKKLRAESLRRQIGIVADVDPLTVTIGSADVEAIVALNSYVPIIGDRVFVVRAGADVVVLGAIADGPEDEHTFSFQTGWSDFAFLFEPARYYRHAGRCYLKGAVKNNGTGTGSIATLPAGYRPEGTAWFATSINTGVGATANLSITATGVISVAPFNANSKAATWMDGISFRIAN